MNTSSDMPRGDNDADLEQGLGAATVDTNKIDDAELDALLDELEDKFPEVDIKEVPEEKMDTKSIPEEMLQTDEKSGLTTIEVNLRRRKYGLNKLREEKENPYLKFLGYFVGPIQFVMEAAMCISAGLRHWVDLGVIAFLLLLNACVGFGQDYQAGSIVNSLKKTLALKARVLRDGQLIEVDASEVVPGDLLKLEEGIIASADGRIITKDALLQVDQSGITGESLPATKRYYDTCFASSTIKRGEAFMVVSATGDNTSVGRAAALVNASSGGSGHFKEVLNKIGSTLLGMVAFTLLVVWISGFYRSTDIIAILRLSLGILVVGVPVGLPAVITTTMAVGASFLAKKQAIVQKLSAIESLAGAEVLCSDKTGTLTQNKLSMNEPYLIGDTTADDMVLVACLAASRKKSGIEPIDKVFLQSLRHYKHAKSQLPRYKTIEFQPFDPVSKKVVAVVELPNGERMTCVKGEPNTVCTFVGTQSDICEEIADSFNDKVAEFASRGFRAIGIACQQGNKPWQLMGIMPLHDPPRYDTAETINEAKALGLRVKMLTGDHISIAKETSRQLGLGTNIFHATKLGLGTTGTAPGSEVYDLVEDADGFAGVFPEHKHMVVDILQQRGYLVAMTGDGVNDAPSLKQADTGIAVEGATEAARSAADIVFLAPGLSAIIDAVKTSRRIFHRMHSYIVYRIALSLHLEIFLGLWIAIMGKSLNVDLLVFIAIFADIATLTIAYDNAPYSKSPVKWDLPKIWGMSIILGCILAAGTWIAYTTMMKNGPDGGIVQGHGHADAVLFLQITLTQNWLILITRAKGSFWSSLPSWKLLLAVLLVDIAATLMCYFGAFVGHPTHWIALVRVWVYSIGIFLVAAFVYAVIQGSQAFERLVHRQRKEAKNCDRRHVEDHVVEMRRISSRHERESKPAASR